MTLEIKRVKLDDIHQDPANARKHGQRNLEAIRGSLRQFGQVEPLVVQKGTGKVIGGNGRVEAMRLLGLHEADVVEVDVDDTKAAALGIALNRTGELAEWDLDVLDRLTADLKEHMDLSELGFDDEDLQGLLGEEKKEVVEDEVPEPSNNPVTKLGDLWILGEHRLLCGDSTDAGNVKRVVHGQEPFIMVTDPPYGVEYEPEWRAEYKENGNCDYKLGRVLNDDIADWTAAYELFIGDVAYVWHAGAKASLVAANLNDANFLIRAQLIWSKQHFVFGRGAYHWQHEPCWYAVRNGKSARWAGSRDQSTVWNIANRNPVGVGSKDDADTFHGTPKALGMHG